MVLIVLALLEYYNKGIKILYANGFQKYCYLVFVEIIVDYEKQILIIEKKSYLQYSKC